MKVIIDTWGKNKYGTHNRICYWRGTDADAPAVIRELAAQGFKLYSLLGAIDWVYYEFSHQDFIESNQKVMDYVFGDCEEHFLYRNRITCLTQNWIAHKEECRHGRK